MEIRVVTALGTDTEWNPRICLLAITIEKPSLLIHSFHKIFIEL